MPPVLNSQAASSAALTLVILQTFGRCFRAAAQTQACRA